MATDRLALAHVIEEAGIARDGAEKVASAIFDAIHDNVATKQDVAALQAAMKVDIASLQAATKTDIAAVRADLSELEQRTITRLVELEHRLTVRGVSALVVAVGIILAALRFLGHG